MRKILLLSLSLVSAWSAPFSRAGGLTSSELPDLVEKILPSVVNISSTTIIQQTLPGWEDFMRHWGVPQERKQSSLGSGFLIDKDGYIITNNHVVERASELVVTLSDKKQYSARIVGLDPKLDIALIQIRDPKLKNTSELKPVTIGDSEKVRIAEGVVAIGNPFGLQHTVTTGIISAKNRTIGAGPFDNFLQTDAAINPGNSGGPLFNLKGEVIGINSVIFSKTGQSGGLGFAIPVNEAIRIVPDLKRYGRTPRPWLGILGEKVTPAIQNYYNLPREDGVVIYNLVDQGPADQAGMQQGDIITSIADQKTIEPNDVERILAQKKPGESVQVQIQRRRKTMNLNVKLRDLPPRLSQLPQGII